MAPDSTRPSGTSRKLKQKPGCMMPLAPPWAEGLLREVLAALAASQEVDA
jgi:hypothetical protein